MQQIATRIVFFIAGLGLAAWAPLVPFAKERAQLDDGALGMLLLCLGVGSVIAMPLAGALAAKRGCRYAITAATLAMGLALPFLATLSSLPSLMASLFVFGMGVAALDVSMNVQAILVERASGKTLMSGVHGMFSLGGICGAAGVTVFLGMGVPPAAATAGVLLLIIAALIVSFSGLLPYGSGSEGPLFALPRGIVLLLGGICFVVFMMEGAVLDWSAVFLASYHGFATERAGIGYTAFACTMTLGRLTGDRIVRWLGGSTVVLLGGIGAALGVFLTLLPWWPVALGGYALIGAGCSNIVPVMFSAVGRQNVMPQNVAIPAVTTLGYVGILAGPAAIGFVANHASLAAAFVILAVLLVGVSASARCLRT